MQRVSISALLGTALCVSVVAGQAPAIASDEAGAAAFTSGDFARAEAEWKPGADKGDVEAEFGLGEVYEQGKGNYRDAAGWYDKAAEQGNEEAKYRLMLIWMAGNKDFPPDLAKAYGWMLLAADDPGQPRILAQLRQQLEANTSEDARAEGRKFAESWKAAHHRPSSPPAKLPEKVVVAPPAPAPPMPTPPAPTPGEKIAAAPSLPTPAPIPPAPAPQPAPAPPEKTVVGPTPTPPAPTPLAPTPPAPPPPAPVPEEKVVAAPSPPPAPPPARPEEKIAAATPQPPAPPTPTAPPPDQQVAAVPPVPPNARDVLEEALKGMNCAAIHVRPSADGTMAVFGSVADEESRAKLRTIAATLPAAQRPALSVDIIPAPLCHSVVQIDNLPRDGVAAAGVIEAKLLGDPVLHENQPIQVEVDSQASYPIVVRIDYFTLDDQVLHMWPNEFISATQVAPGEKKKFLHRRPDGPDPDWLVGGAPFGTELISVIATPRPLNLGAKRPMIESATTYLKDLTNALRLMRATGAQPALVATTFIHTAGQ